MSVISAGTTSDSSIKFIANSDGTLTLKTNDNGSSGGTTALTLAANQAATFASTVNATTAFSVGSSIATTGEIRLKVGQSIVYRNVGNTVDLNLVSIGSGNILTFGGNDQGHIYHNVATGQAHYKQVNGVTVTTTSSTGLAVTGAITGSSQIVSNNNSSGFNWKFTGGSDMFYNNGNGAGTAASNTVSVFWIRADSVTSRSINAGGTINASGADYAEYETKADTCGVVAKGQIVGFDADGKVTDKWADAISFGVKSTAPSYVGGDAWGSEDALGVTAPEKPADDATDEEKAQYESDKAAFEAVLEAARQKVDRVAYSGKVPVNVTGANVGDYIIAVQNGDGIDGQAVADPDFTQYKRAVGRVRRILEDGRAEIAVVIH